MVTSVSSSAAMYSSWDSTVASAVSLPSEEASLTSEELGSSEATLSSATELSEEVEEVEAVDAFRRLVPPAQAAIEQARHRARNAAMSFFIAVFSFAYIVFVGCPWVWQTAPKPGGNALLSNAPIILRIHGKVNENAKMRRI